MGVWHFIPMGESPGAVTSALAYIKRRYEQNDLSFFGSDSNRRQVKKVSGIVIFTTSEVRRGLRPPAKRSCIDNQYGAPQGKEIYYGSEQGLPSAFDTVNRFLAKEFQQILQAEKGQVYWLEASYHNLDFNLRQLIRAFYALSPPNKTGREVWVNLTGGSNVMNLATLLVTILSGITGRAYYTYTQDIRLLRPSNENDFWYDIPVLKVNFDRDYEAILRVLDEQGDWLDSKELLNRVKGRRYQFSATEDSFAADYLNKLDGWLIKRDKNRNRLLQPTGKQFLELIQDNLVRALIYKEALPETLTLTDVFQEIPL